MFGRRSAIILAATLAWALCAAAMLFHIAVQEREFYLEMGGRMAWKRGVIPAPRGKILDPEGNLVAWSERYFDLWLDTSEENPGKEKRLMRALENALGPLGDNHVEDENGRIPLKKGLSPEEAVAIEKLMEKHREIIVTSRLERRRAGTPETMERAGEVETRDGRIFGTSGMEKEFDERLRGREGAYKVMLDRKGRWIRNTWTLESEAVAGENITADFPADKKSPGSGKEHNGKTD